MAVDVERLVKTGSVVDSKHHALSPGKPFPGFDRKARRPIDRPSHALLEQCPKIELLSGIGGTRHAALLAAFHQKGNRPSLGQVEIGRDRIGWQGEIIRKSDRSSIAPAV